MKIMRSNLIDNTKQPILISIRSDYVCVHYFPHYKRSLDIITITIAIKARPRIEERYSKYNLENAETERQAI